MIFKCLKFFTKLLFAYAISVNDSLKKAPQLAPMAKKLTL